MSRTFGNAMSQSGRMAGDVLRDNGLDPACESLVEVDSRGGSRILKPNDRIRSGPGMSLDVIRPATGGLKNA